MYAQLMSKHSKLYEGLHYYISVGDLSGATNYLDHNSDLFNDVCIAE